MARFWKVARKIGGVAVNVARIPLVQVLAVCLALAMSSLVLSNTRKAYRAEAGGLRSQLEAVTAERDSLECLQRAEGVVIAKAGEFAVRPRGYETDFTVEAAAILLTELAAETLR